jgi:ATP-dependent protease ClpP protease subunit
MKRIKIDSDIASYGITAAAISAEIDAVPPEEEIEIIIASAGGSVYEGVAIFNIIRAAAKNHIVSVLIQGLAASMASYVALAAKAGNPESIIRVEDNAVYMIHNPYVIDIGDYRQFQKTATLLDRFSALLSSTYSVISKKSDKQIRSLMDDETYYIGKEIVDAGFADEVVSTSNDENNTNVVALGRDALIASARISIDKSRATLTESREHDGMEKAVALLDQTAGKPNNPAAKNTNPAVAGMEERMNPEELLAKYPDCYKAVLAKGAEQEHKRVEAHLKMGEAAGSLEVAAKYIRDGSGLGDDTVIAEYQASAMKNRMIVARAGDDPAGGGQHKPGKDDGKAEMLAALDHEIGAK